MTDLAEKLKAKAKSENDRIIALLDAKKTKRTKDRENDQLMLKLLGMQPLEDELHEEEDSPNSFTRVCVITGENRAKEYETEHSYKQEHPKSLYLTKGTPPEGSLSDLNLQMLDNSFKKTSISGKAA